MSFRSLSRPLAALSVLALLATGCSGGDDKDKEADQASSSAPPSGNPHAPGATNPVPEPAKGGGPLQVRPVLAQGSADQAQDGVDPALLEDFDAFECGAAGEQAKPADPTMACDSAGTKYLLGPAVKGGGIDRAVPYRFLESWSVGLFIADDTLRALEKQAKKPTAPAAIAFEFGGVVLTAPSLGDAVGRGRTAVNGKFDEKSATALAKRIAKASGV